MLLVHRYKWPELGWVAVVGYDKGAQGVRPSLPPDKHHAFLTDKQNNSKLFALAIIVGVFTSPQSL